MSQAASTGGGRVCLRLQLVLLRLSLITGRGPTINEKFREREIKRQRQGLQMNEMNSHEQLDVRVYNLGLARQTVQHKAEHRMLRMQTNQTSHIMILVEGSSLTVNLGQ